MSIIKLSNGGSLLEERFSFPDPEIIIRSVFRFEDIKYLKARSASEVASLVYFYGDRDYLNNLTYYVGETQLSPLKRYTNTHSKKEWCQKLKYPVIGMVEGAINPWDTETRKTIESLTAHKMKQAGFATINADTMNWTHGVIIPPTVNGAYADSVANILVNHQIALLGLSGFDVKEIAKTLGYQFEEEKNYEADETVKITLEDFVNPNFIRAEEKFISLIKTGQIVVGEPLYINHKIIKRAVIFRKPDAVEYKGNLFKPREVIKLMAHEAYTEGLTSKHQDGWHSYDPFTNFFVERNNEHIRLSELWELIKPISFLEGEHNEVIDEDWHALVTSNSLVGSQVSCNGKIAMIEDGARIRLDDKVFYSLTEYGEAVEGLNELGWGEFLILHQGETYTVKSD